MSDDVLSVIPTDPHWQPDRAGADRTAARATKLAHPDGSGPRAAASRRSPSRCPAAAARPRSTRCVSLGRAASPRFGIALWNPQRLWFDDEQLAALAGALGHPVRQIRARI
ncbi:hypothetical protein [Streptomyces canus]|uniref:hypothetical protein n=1 Tax=Streptomyces canus TaxID=58343 RepID=UPI003CF02F9E